MFHWLGGPIILGLTTNLQVEGSDDTPQHGAAPDAACVRVPHLQTTLSPYLHKACKAGSEGCEPTMPL